MDRFPSKIGLLLGRACLYIHVCLIAWLISKSQLMYGPTWLGLCLAILPWIVLACTFATITWKVYVHRRFYDRFRGSARISLLGPPAIRDYWQSKWREKSQRDVRTNRDVWRIPLTVLMVAAAAGFFLIYVSFVSPESKFKAPDVVVGWFTFSFLLGPFLGWAFPYARRPGHGFRPQAPSRGPDDYGPAGVGARLIPPRPTLVAGSQFPTDDERYA